MSVLGRLLDPLYPYAFCARCLARMFADHPIDLDDRDATDLDIRIGHCFRCDARGDVFRYRKP